MVRFILFQAVLLLLPYLLLANVGLPVFSFRHESVQVSTPALKAGHTLKMQDFTDYLSTIKNSDLMVTFLQDELSGEDFLRPDENMRYGDLLKHVKMLVKKPTSTYFSSVKSPFHSLSAAMDRYDEVVEVKNGADAVTYLSNTKLQKGMAIVVHLPPTNVEASSKALKRNDVIVGEVMNVLEQSGLTYTAFYTAKRFRKMYEEVVVQGGGRHLLAEVGETSNDTKLFYSNNETDCILYIDTLIANNITFRKDKTDIGCENNGNTTTITISDPSSARTVRMEFSVDNSTNMWQLSSVTVDGEIVVPADNFETPKEFCYHCSITSKFYSADGEMNGTVVMSIKTIQVQVFDVKEGKFGLAYDCVGFFTIPLWTGLLTALFLVTVTAYGLMMLSSVQTFDQYDDPKNKPLVVNISE